MTKLLTIIIPFKNEGDEVFRTIRNLNRVSDSSMFDIVAINDASDDGRDYSSLSRIGNVRYIVNEARLGVAGSRDFGVKLAQTPYIMLLDAHMRIERNIIPDLLAVLARVGSEKVLYCLQSKIMRVIEGTLTIDSRTPSSRGAVIDLSDPNNVVTYLGVEWDTLKPGDESEIDIPCVLGAGYAMHKEYYMHLHGLNGLVGYGMDEQFISAKVWLSGGRCVLLKDIEIGHIYRTAQTIPYNSNGEFMLMNRLIFAELILPKTIRDTYMEAHKNMVPTEVFGLLSRMADEIAGERNYLQTIFTKEFSQFLSLNKWQ